MCDWGGSEGRGGEHQVAERFRRGGARATARVPPRPKLDDVVVHGRVDPRWVRERWEGEALGRHGVGRAGGGAGAVELVGVLRHAHEQEVRQRESERRRQGGGMHRARGKDVASPGTDRGHEAGVEVLVSDFLDPAG